MRRQNRRARGPRRARLIALVAGALASAFVGPVSAQSIPWVGLAAPGAQLHGEIGQYPHSPTSADHFGFAVAAGDFNGDGVDDLASGIPGNDCDVVVWDCGSVQLRFGTSEGLLTSALTLDPEHPGAPDPAEAFDEYGWALATGDFDADGLDDLAVGVPGDWLFVQPGPAMQAGAVKVHYGLQSSPPSLTEILFQPFATPARPWEDERFGHALAVGDFNGDGHDDLAIGTPGNWVRPAQPDFQAGSVHVAHGHAGGLVPFAGFEMALGLDALPDVPEESDDFGYALAAGDFNGDGFDDLAIGVPGANDVPDGDAVGRVLVVYGSPVSLIFPDHRYFGSFELGGEAQPGMRFGERLAVGDFDGDGRDDLAIGAPRYDGQGQSQPEDMGVVAVVYGPPLDPTRVHWLWEDLFYGAGNSDPFDRFGSALAAGDFDGDGIDDLGIGTPGESFPLFGSTGAVSVVPGRLGDGVTGESRQLRPVRGFPDSPIGDPSGLIPDCRVGGPSYGASLAAGDFDGNGFADLAIGAPYRDLFQPAPSQTDTGAVAVVYSQLFADDFETENTAAWTVAVP